MESPFIATDEVAKLCQVKVQTIRKWNSVNRHTGEKYRPGFPDQCHKGFFIRAEVYRALKLPCN